MLNDFCFNPYNCILRLFFFGTFNLLLLVILVVVTHAQYDWPDF